MLNNNAEYEQCQVMSGDCGAFYTPSPKKNGEKDEPRQFGPAEATHISGATGNVFHFGGIYSDPMLLSQVYMPHCLERRLANRDEGAKAGRKISGFNSQTEENPEDEEAVSTPVSRPRVPCVPAKTFPLPCT